MKIMRVLFLALTVSIMMLALSCNNENNKTETKNDLKSEYSAENSNVTPGFNHKIPKEIMTPNKVQTSIGELNFYDGVPSEETIKKVYDNLDFLRGVDVFLNFIPANSLEGMRKGMESIGIDDYNKVLVFDELADSHTLFLTGNSSTVYAWSLLDLERDGATVVEIPAGAGPGTVNDAFFRFVVDMGVPGPDAKKGGTYIILPPDYKGDLKPTKNSMKYRGKDMTVTIEIAGKKTKVWIAQSKSYVNWIVLRGFTKDGKPDFSSNMWRTGLKIYPLKDAANPKKMEYKNGTGIFFNTIHANDYTFYEEAWNVIQKEPISFLDPELRGQLSAIGIQKGKPFNPDARMKKILTNAIAVGNATARAICFRNRDEKSLLFENRYWRTGFVGRDYRWLKDDGMGGRDMDARVQFFYMATVNTPAMALQVDGVGSNYALCTQDSKGETLYGSKNYKMVIPANVPAEDFWSVVVYDPQTRSELQVPGGSDYPKKNNKIDKDMKYNEDGSVTLYFGPELPKGVPQANWIQTVPNKAWFSLFRLYGPKTPWFEKTWVIGDFELIK